MQLKIKDSRSGGVGPPDSGPHGSKAKPRAVGEAICLAGFCDPFIFHRDIPARSLIFHIYDAPLLRWPLRNTGDAETHPRIQPKGSAADDCPDGLPGRPLDLGGPRFGLAAPAGRVQHHARAAVPEITRSPFRRTNNWGGRHAQ